jgi:hypothetical protein
MPDLLYLDQNYLSGIAKAKPAFRELEPVLRAAVAADRVAVVESAVHELESRPRPDLGLLELLRELSGGRRLPDELDEVGREIRARMERTIARELPQRAARASDAADLDALALAVRHCDLVTCDAFMADVIRRTRMHVRYGCDVFSGRRPDVLRLRDALAAEA